MQRGENGVSNGNAERQGQPRPQPSRSALERSELLSGTGTWEWDLETDVVLWSDNMFRLFGLEPGAIEPTPDEVVRRTHPADRQRAEDETEAARQARRPPGITHRVVWPDGTVRVLRGATALEGPRHDRPSRLVGSLQDVTALLNSERGTAESQTLMEALQGAASIGFAFVDREMRFVRINEALARANGLDPESCVGRTVAEMVPDLWPRLEPVFSKVIDRGEPETHFEAAREEAGSGTGRYLVSHHPVRIDGEVAGVGVVVFLDSAAAAAE